MADEKTPNAPKRFALTAKQRDVILKKTGGHCHLCGGPAGDDWQADHVVPQMRGGTSDLSNLLPSCSECNGLRSAKSPEGIRKRFRLGVYAWPEVKKGTRTGRKLKSLVDKKIAANARKRRKSKDREKDGLLSAAPRPPPLPPPHPAGESPDPPTSR